MAMTGRRLDGFGRCASSREPAGVLTPHTAKTAERKTALPFLAEGEGFEPPDACTSTVFKTAAFDRSANLPFEIAEKNRQFFIFVLVAIARCRRQRTSASEVPLRQPSVLKLPRKADNFLFLPRSSDAVGSARAQAKYRSANLPY